MSKMKHLLRKLHIGSGGGGGAAALSEPHRLDIGDSLRPVPVPSPSLSPGPIPVQPVRSSSPTPPDSRSDEFSFFEEEFQVQLALAISASSADHVDPREDPDESAQINAAKRISLGCPAAEGGGCDSGALVELLSLRYWSYNVVNYDEKVMDGFYDVHGIQSSTVGQGKMPSLVDLQAVSISANIDYEVILVNRVVDPELQQLETMAMALSVESRASEYGPIVSGLVQKVADMVVNRMGGPVFDADEMVKRWTLRSYELRNSLNSIVLPLGQLDIGLSRHRALLFKVLADRIDLPCKLVKGSYYTGTDEGAVDLIRIENGSEYIIDLMGAPGTLIPAEVPSIYVPNPELAIRSSAEISSVVLDGGSQTLLGETDLGIFPRIVGSKPSGLPAIGPKRDEMSCAEKNQTERFEHEFGKLLPSLRISHESESSISGKATPAQKMKVKNVSKYVISAARNPEFAQKLHAVLLESGASPPPDLFSDTDGSDLSECKVPKNFLARNFGDYPAQSNPDKFSMSHEQNLYYNGIQSIHDARYCRDSESCAIDFLGKLAKLDTNASGPCYTLSSEANSEGFVLVKRGSKERIQTDALSSVDPYQRQVGNATMSGNDHCLQERADNSTQVSCSGENEKLNPVLGDAAEWDIKWEDLQIGERIGIGSYGEVYRADWNGTEVAVKKFLDQDVSGEALVQFKCEVEIMLRLRHPNVVLFMGAVTRPPHFSILTEFLP
ncbi:hypothetical protein CRG98_008956, partial [Punica granatum]